MHIHEQLVNALTLMNIHDTNYLEWSLCVWVNNPAITMLVSYFTPFWRLTRFISAVYRYTTSLWANMYRGTSGCE